MISSKISQLAIAYLMLFVIGSAEGENSGDGCFSICIPSRGVVEGICGFYPGCTINECEPNGILRSYRCIKSEQPSPSPMMSPRPSPTRTPHVLQPPVSASASPSTTLLPHSGTDDLDIAGVIYIPSAMPMPTVTPNMLSDCKFSVKASQGRSTTVVCECTKNPALSWEMGYDTSTMESCVTGCLTGKVEDDETCGTSLSSKVYVVMTMDMCCTTTCGGVWSTNGCVAPSS